jgi:nicotinamidase-related amidase
MKAFALLLLAVLAGLALAAIALFVRSMFVATKGKKIAPYPDPRKALLVLDLQEGYVGTATRQPVTAPPATGLFATVNRLIDKAAESGMEVAYVRQVFSNNLIVRLHGGRRQGRVIIDRRVKVVNGNDFEKNRTDAFSNRQLEQFLIDRHVNELYLVGVDAAYCVYYTALGALNRGYRVTVVTDAVASRKPMADVLARYRRRGIAVATSAQLTGAVERDTRQTKDGEP